MKYIKLYRTHLPAAIRMDLSAAFQNSSHAVVLCKHDNHLHYLNSLCVGCLLDNCTNTCCASNCCALYCASSCCASSCCASSCLCCGEERPVNYFADFGYYPSLDKCIIQHINIDTNRSYAIFITFPYIEKIGDTVYMVPTIDGSIKRVDLDSITLPSSVTYVGMELRLEVNFSSGASSPTDPIVELYDSNGYKFSYNYNIGCPLLSPYISYSIVSAGCASYSLCTAY